MELPWNALYRTEEDDTGEGQCLGRETRYSLRQCSCERKGLEGVESLDGLEGASVSERTLRVVERDYCRIRPAQQRLTKTLFMVASMKSVATEHRRRKSPLTFFFWQDRSSVSAPLRRGPGPQLAAPACPLRRPDGRPRQCRSPRPRACRTRRSRRRRH